MKRSLIPGLILGIGVVIWQFVYGALGLYKEASTGWIFSVVAVLMQIGVITWGLMQTAKDGKRYWGQVGSGMVITVVAGILIVIGSFIFTSVAFPDVFDYVAEQQGDALSARGLSEEQIEQQLEVMSFTRTSGFNAGIGLFFTLLTGFIVSLIVSAFIRKKD